VLQCPTRAAADLRLLRSEEWEYWRPFGVGELLRGENGEVQMQRRVFAERAFRDAVRRHLSWLLRVWCAACCVLQFGVGALRVAPIPGSACAQTTSLSYRVQLSCLPGVEREVQFHLVGMDSLIGDRLKRINRFIHIDRDQNLGRRPTSISQLEADILW
jgi:hypothetical protein